MKGAPIGKGIHSLLREAIPNKVGLDLCPCIGFQGLSIGRDPKVMDWVSSGNQLEFFSSGAGHVKKWCFPAPQQSQNNP